MGNMLESGGAFCSGPTHSALSLQLGIRPGLILPRFQPGSLSLAVSGSYGNGVSALWPTCLIPHVVIKRGVRGAWGDVCGLSHMRMNTCFGVARVNTHTPPPAEGPWCRAPPSAAHPPPPGPRSVENTSYGSWPHAKLCVSTE